MNRARRGTDLARAVLAGQIDPSLEEGQAPALLLELAQSHVRLEERLAKIIVIGDKYQAEALEAGGRLRDALEQLGRLRGAATALAGEAPGPGAVTVLRPAKKKARDPLSERIRLCLAQPGGAVDPGDVETLLKRYEKSNSRLDKIVTISDGYQAQLRDVSLRLEYMARTDSLTGLPNRRDMIERLEAEYLRLQRYGSSRFALILFDIDDFKAVNDLYGHDVGDKVLRMLALVFGRELRKSDSCARWGGEEFLVLCPEAGEAEALVVAEKCRLAAAEAVVATPTGEVRITLSGGVCASDCGSDIDGLIRRSDEALYRAKAAGKNQVLPASLGVKE